MSNIEPVYESRPSGSGVEVSVIVPLLDEAPSLKELASSVHTALEGYTFELVLVDDGSTDNSWDVIRELRASFPAIQGIRFQRNYGKSTALQAGFEVARGRYVVTMDADLQDDPAEIPGLLAMLREGYDLVSGWKKKRKDPLSKTIPSRFFNFVTRWVTGIRLHDFNCGLKVYRREVIENIHLHGELHRYVPLLARWEGFGRISEKPVRHHERKYGRTKFGVSRFVYGFLDLLTLMFVSTYMNRPMHFFGSIGVFSLAGGIGINAYLAWMKLVHNEPLANRPLLILGVLLVVIGVQFFSIGFLGDMINRGRVNRDRPNIKDRI
ncbi:MAG: glycosyltransferase family 2 protein [Balneolaceae bacterium]